MAAPSSLMQCASVIRSTPLSSHKPSAAPPHSPFAAQRLRFGAGAGARLADGSFVPLTPQGDLSIKPDGVAVPLVNALDLMTGSLHRCSDA